MPVAKEMRDKRAAREETRIMFQEIGPAPERDGKQSLGWQYVMDLHRCETPHLDDIS